MSRPDSAAASAALTPAAALDVVRDPYSVHTEALRTLRQTLTARRAEGQSLVLAVVSPGVQEGRSRLSAELAWLFAQLGEPTLLIDACLRSPAQHLLFGGAKSIGLSDAVLDKGMPSLNPVKGADALRVVSAGTPPERPVEILSSRGFREMLEQWRGQFPTIVIDTPAFASSSDAMALSAAAGSALLLAREQKTELAALRQCATRLEGAGVALLGTVMLAF